jgi:flagellin-like hook-associated protein FlgL
MRVTQNMLFQQAVDGVHRHTETLALRQAQISSGRRWTRPSEDPAAAAESMTLRARGEVIERLTRGARDATDRLDAAASTLQSLSDLLAEAKETAVNAGNPTLTATDRATLASEIDNILGQVLEAGNRRDAFGFLFAGTAATIPFVKGANGIEYMGNGATQPVAAGDDYFIGAGLPGSAVFQSEERGTTLFLGGGTGVKAGTGTDSGKDRGVLTITHGATTLGDGALAGGDSASGVKLGASSAALDTVLGPAGAHTLAIDAVNGTIRLDNGPAVAFTGTETDLAVSDGAGGVVHVDLTSVSPGFNGAVSIASSGFLSTDGGATQTALDFTANQVVVNAADGSTTNVDTTGVRKTGTELVDYVGTTSLFEALEGLRDDLLNYDSLDPATRDASLTARSREIGRNLETVLRSLAELGARSSAAQGAATRYQTLADDMKKSLSSLEDADFAEVVVDYNRAQIALELAQAAGARLMQTNYLAFLQ